MKSVSVSRHIDADPQIVWDLITDAQYLASGGLGILRLEGDIRLGNSLKLWSDVSPGRAFALKVSEFTPASRMVWSGGMPLGLFNGRRSFTLAPTDGGTAFSMREDFTGPLSGPIWRSMPDLQPSFHTFADGLARKAEGAST